MSRPDAQAPIGIFDSGIGGLTVAHELIAQLPDERLLYVGDTARVPYGNKSPDTVRRYSAEIAHFLVEQGVKAIVVACNTATAHALLELRAQLPVPVIGVIEPGARAAVEASHGGEIGVIGTSGTIASGAYERAIRALRPDARIVVQPCPLFVPLVEEGWLAHEATRVIAREYLAPLLAVGIDALVLGCTHYPLLAPLLQDIVGPSVRLIDSAAETAREVRACLDEKGLLALSLGSVGMSPASHRFVATDAPTRFLTLGTRFLGLPIERVETVAFG